MPVPSHHARPATPWLPTGPASATAASAKARRTFAAVSMSTSRTSSCSSTTASRSGIVASSSSATFSASCGAPPAPSTVTTIESASRTRSIDGPAIASKRARSATATRNAITRRTLADERGSATGRPWDLDRAATGLARARRRPGVGHGVGDAVEGFLDAEVLVDGVAVRRSVRRLPEQVAISAWCDTRDLPPGLHEITVDRTLGGRQPRRRLAAARRRRRRGRGVVARPRDRLARRRARPRSATRSSSGRSHGRRSAVRRSCCSTTARYPASERSSGSRRRSPADEVDIVIGDEASMIAEQRWVRWRKRAFEPEALPSIDQVGPLLAVGPRAADVLCDALPAGAGLYGLALELLDRGLRTVALPHVLALTPEVRAARRRRRRAPAVERLAARRGRPVTIEAGPVEGLRDVRWPLAEPPAVVAVIPSRTPALAARCLAGLAERTDYARRCACSSSTRRRRRARDAPGRRRSCPARATCLRVPGRRAVQLPARREPGRRRAPATATCCSSTTTSSRWPTTGSRGWSSC